MSKKKDKRQAHELSKELVRLRKEASYKKGYCVTQKMIARELGITQAAMSQYEHGRRIPSQELLNQIYQKYGKEA